MKRCLAFLMLFSILLCGCEKQKATIVETELPHSDFLVGLEPNLTDAPIPKNQNLLTGLPDLTEEAIGKRPVAVMINNVKGAMPQYGISQADVIFEMPVEANLTRLMALYADYTQMPDICSIRSCRYYFPAVSEGFDAFYVHWGMDPSVKDYIASLNLDRYNGSSNTGKLFARDKDRINAGYSLEHTAYFKGTQFAAAVAKAGKRTELTDDKKGTAFNFCPIDTLVTPTGDTCNTVTVKFGNATAGFTYDAETKKYYKSFNGSPQVDGRSEEQLAFTNVIVLETNIWTREDRVHKGVDWAGNESTTGYYFSNGAMQKIHWYKENASEKGYLKFFDMDGNELELNRGKTYIAYTYANKTTWQ